MPSGQACTSHRKESFYHALVRRLTLPSCLSCVRQGLKKVIPGSPEGEVPVHEKKSPVFTRVQK
jgi:NADH dehydrogenase (ubiquinone) 1 alpha subcomplex subunit 8